MKKAVSLSLLSLAICATSAHATQDKVAARKESLIKGIQEQLQKTDLRRDGVYNAFQLAKDLGYVEINTDLPYWSTEGGGQLGSMVETYGESETLNLSRTTGWASKITQLFCEPSATVTKKYSSGQSYPAVNESLKSTGCFNIGIETSLDVGGLEDNNPFAQRDGVFVPDYSAEIRIGQNGKIELQYAGNSTPSYMEKVYIASPDYKVLSKREVEFRNKNKEPDYTFSSMTEHNAYEGSLNAYVLGEPIATINQGVLDKKQILEEMKNVEWTSYGHPSFTINLQKAQAHLSLVSADAQTDAKKLLDLIAKHQSLSNEKKAIEHKNGLFGSLELQIAETACRNQFKETRKTTYKCRSVYKEAGDQSVRRFNFAGTADIREKIAQTYLDANALIAARMSQLDKDPSFLRFIVALSTTERIKN